MIDSNTENSIPVPVGDLLDKPTGVSAIPKCVKILFPLPLSKAYDYLVPSDAKVELGAWVKAPFGPREIFGVVWSAGCADEEQDQTKLKKIIEVLDVPALSASTIVFVNWVARYTMFPLGAVLRLVMRTGNALEPKKPIFSYVLGRVLPDRMTPARARVLEIADDQARSVSELKKRAGVSDAVVRGLVKLGSLIAVEQDADAPFEKPDALLPGKSLSVDQAAAVSEITSLIDASTLAPMLIDGVTGSGKTEVYLEGVAGILRKSPDAQVLIMLPEIALTLPFLTRVGERFGAVPAGWHSGMKPAERRRVWRRVLDGNAQVIVGARSALFLPYKNLKMIIVDEEHESAYKQEDGVIYHGRDMAVARAKLDDIPILLASATPSLESVVNVDQGRYNLLRLSSRFGKAQLPTIDLVDLRAEPPEKGRWLSPSLVDAVTECLFRKEQVLLFLNRRGYAPLTICRRCGHRMKAPHSDTWLVHHRFENRLVCHHTGFSMLMPDACPTCKAVDGLVVCGPGVERVAEEAQSLWPDARHAILSSDNPAANGGIRGVLDQMEANEIDVLVATQMVAKGHHFPNLTLVGVVDADMGLSGGDLRAAERTYQLMSQVSGRAGRSEKAGRAMLQTYQPDAPVLQALAGGERDDFLAAEAEGRMQLGFPPYGRLVAIILKSMDEAALKKAGEEHRQAITNGDGVEVWGPAPAPLYRLKGQMRIRFLIKARRDVNIQKFVSAWLSTVKLKSSVRRTVDIDPYSFL